ncbi:MAG: amidase [Pseudomonadota bacterium]
MPLYYESATKLRDLIRDRKISVLELIESFLTRIDSTNPVLNAIVTRCDESAMSQAAELDRAFNPAGKPLYGLPIAVKDLALTEGLRTTFGSPIFESFVPTEDDLFVARLRAAGAIIIGKTNTPEFGAGSQTFNQIFGSTKNPYDPQKTCGGSSGGAAVAIATGMLPFADGSDLGGSLRNPAAFCNVVGFRPSPGRVPNWPKQFSSEQLAVSGPMAREVTDVALLLSVMAGPDPRVPISLNEPGEIFNRPLARGWRNTKIAFSSNLNLFEVDREISQTLEHALPVFETLGMDIREDCPDLSSAEEIFTTLRGWMFAARFEELLKQHREKIKDTVVWNIEQGLQLTVSDLTRAESLRSTLIANTAKFFQDYDFLVCPSTQVLPFPIETEWIREINGVQMSSYLGWMGICWAITVTGCPAISLPIGFSRDGLPIGMQIVAPRGKDFELLQLAYAFEQETQHARTHPVEATITRSN